VPSGFVSLQTIGRGNNGVVTNVLLAWPSLDDVISDSQTESVSDALVSLLLANRSHGRDTQRGLIFMALTHEQIHFNRKSAHVTFLMVLLEIAEIPRNYPRMHKTS